MWRSAFFFPAAKITPLGSLARAAFAIAPLLDTGERQDHTGR
jgi:hypothetical protein